MFWKIYCLREEFQEAGWSFYWHHEGEEVVLQRVLWGKAAKAGGVRDGELSGL